MYFAGKLTIGFAVIILSIYPELPDEFFDGDTFGIAGYLLAVGNPFSYCLVVSLSSFSLAEFAQVYRSVVEYHIALAGRLVVPQRRRAGYFLTGITFAGMVLRAGGIRFSVHEPFPFH